MAIFKRSPTDSAAVTAAGTTKVDVAKLLESETVQADLKEAEALFVELQALVEFGGMQPVIVDVDAEPYEPGIDLDDVDAQDVQGAATP